MDSMSASSELEVVGTAIRFRAACGRFELSLHWLRAHCCCPLCRTRSGQRLVRRSAPRCLALRRALVERDAVLLEWEDGHATSFELAELARFAAWRDRPVPYGMASRRPLSLARLPWSPVPAVREWLELLEDNHIVLLEGVPAVHDMVGQVARCIAPLLRTIYGETWQVTAEAGTTNIAYTAGALPLHQDLTAYESPPGLQLLHCLRYDDDVVGGENTFGDLLAAAESLRAAAPEYFRVLCTVWATFDKVNAQQHMVIRKPHIVVDDHDNIVDVTWAPPFEGPYAGPAALEAAYHAAYAAFERVIESADEVKLRMRPGELVMFNNRRVLHARAGFIPTSAPQGGRILEGCYLGLDDVANLFNQMTRRG